MNWVVCLLITIVLIVLGFIFRKSKILWTIQILWMWILMAGSNGGVDWTTHTNIFYSSGSIEIFGDSWLYKIMCLPFLEKGLGFYEFNFVISTILIVIMCYLIKKYSKNYCFVTSLIYIYPLADSIIQKRNFCALVIFLCGILPLIKNEKRCNLKFLIFTIIAAQIHSSFYLYLLILPLLLLKDKKLNNYIKILVPICFLLIPFIPKIAQLFVPAAKVNFYFYQLKIPFYQSVCWWILQITFTLLFSKIIKANKEINKFLGNDYIENNRLDKLNKIMLLFMPFYYYEPTFFRFYRNILFVNYIECSKIFDSADVLYKKTASTVGLMACFAVIVFLSQFVFFGKGFEYLVVPIFEQNSILGGV